MLGPKTGPMKKLSAEEVAKTSPETDFTDPLGSLCSRPLTSDGPSRFLSPGFGSMDDGEEDELAQHPTVQAGRAQNLRGGLVVADLTKRGVAECFEEFGLRDYFDQFGQPRFCNLSMSVAARRHPEVSRVFGSVSSDSSRAPEQHVFSLSAVAYRKASSMIERDRQLQKEAKASLYRSLASDERYRMADVRQRQHDLIMHKFPDREAKDRTPRACQFLPPGAAPEAMLPVEPRSRQAEREERRRGERLNMYLAEVTPQSIFVVKRQGWIFNYEDVREISEKIDAWMKAIDLTSNLGVDRSTFSQLFVDLDLYHRDKLPYVWAHQVFDAYAKPMRLTSGDPDFGEDSQEGRIRSSLCVCKWDFMAVLDRLLKARFETPRDTFMTRLRAATGYLAKEWRGKEAAWKREREEARQRNPKSPLSSPSFTLHGLSRMMSRADTKGRSTSKQLGKELMDPPAKPRPLWKHDRYVTGLLKAPEVLQLIEQFRPIFEAMFTSYAQEQRGESTHMTETDLVALCYDLRLVPDLVSRFEVQRVYALAVCKERTSPTEETAPSASASEKPTPSQSGLQAPLSSRTLSQGGVSPSVSRSSSKQTLESTPDSAFSLKLPRPKAKRKTSGRGLSKTMIETAGSSPSKPGEDPHGDPAKGRVFFGISAFAESICRLIFGRLLLYGNSLQQLLAPQGKVIWLLNYICGILQYDRSDSLDPLQNPRAVWRGPSWQKLLQAIPGEEGFLAALPPDLQDSSSAVDCFVDDGTGSRSRSNAFGFRRGMTTAIMVSRAPTPETDEEAEGAETSDVGATPKVKLPPVLRDAVGSEGWILAKLLRSSVDLSFNYKKKEKKDKSHKRASRI